MSRILLIDDDAQVNEVIKATLELLGHTVRCLDGADGVEQTVLDFRPEVTLVDYMLPGCSGLDLLHILSRIQPDSIRCIATGLADFQVLKKALNAGASSMLCKPYRLADVVALLDLAALLESAVRLEHESGPAAEEPVLVLQCDAGLPVQSDLLARLLVFARRRGADDQTVVHRLPVIAGELLKNAATYSGTDYTAEIADLDDSLLLTVSDAGPGFDWQKVMARAGAGMDKPRASGLQVALALSDKLTFEDGGRVIRSRIAKTWKGHTE